MDIDGIADPFDTDDDDALEPGSDGFAGLGPDDFSGGNLFGDELADVDASDWDVDADLLWGSEDAPPAGPDTDFDLPMA